MSLCSDSAVSVTGSNQGRVQVHFRHLTTVILWATLGPAANHFLWSACHLSLTRKSSCPQELANVPLRSGQLSRLPGNTVEVWDDSHLHPTSALQELYPPNWVKQSQTPPRRAWLAPQTGFPTPLRRLPIPHQTEFENKALYCGGSRRASGQLSGDGGPQLLELL